MFDIRKTFALKVFHKINRNERAFMENGDAWCLFNSLIQQISLF